jgi:hypothetical protein
MRRRQAAARNKQAPPRTHAAANRDAGAHQADEAQDAVGEERSGNSGVT